jgi:hypothetical protein
MERMQMAISFRLGVVLGLTLATTLVLPAAAQQQQRSTRVGVLDCSVAPGTGMIITSNKALTCRFRPSDRAMASEAYVGSIRKFGLDIGSTGRGRLTWAVFAPANRPRANALAGEYVGASAEATAGIGGGANLLVGGFERSVNLQPLSINTQRGVNLALGVSEIDLQPATRAPRTR